MSETLIKDFGKGITVHKSSDPEDVSTPFIFRVAQKFYWCKTESEAMRRAKAAADNIAAGKHWTGYGRPDSQEPKVNTLDSMIASLNTLGKTAKALVARSDAGDETLTSATPAVSSITAVGDAMDSGTRVRIKSSGGMKEFYGKEGMIIAKEGKMYRVKFSPPIEIPGVGKVSDDLWEGRLLTNLDRGRGDAIPAGLTPPTDPEARAKFDAAVEAKARGDANKKEVKVTEVIFKAHTIGDVYKSPGVVGASDAKIVVGKRELGGNFYLVIE